MKRIITTALLITLTAMNAGLLAQQVTTKSGFNVFYTTKGDSIEFFKNSYALIIANWDYSSKYEKLDRIPDEVEQLRKALYSIGFRYVEIEWNRSRAQIINDIDDFIRNYGSDPEDRLLIYYTGHGLVTSEGQEDKGWIVPVDAVEFTPDLNWDKLELSHQKPEEYKKYKNEQKAFEKSAVDFDLLKSYVTLMRAKHALLMFDCCFGGQAITKSNPPTLEITSKILNPTIDILSAGNRFQQVPAVSKFLEFFIKAVTGKDPEADRNKDGYLQATELHWYIHLNVKKSIKDEPMIGKEKGDKWQDGEYVFKLPWAGELGSHSKDKKDRDHKESFDFSKIKTKTPAALPLNFYDRPLSLGSIRICTDKPGVVFIGNNYTQKLESTSCYQVRNVPAGNQKIDLQTVGRTYSVEVNVVKNEIADVKFESSGQLGFNTEIPNFAHPTPLIPYYPDAAIDRKTDIDKIQTQMIDGRQIPRRNIGIITGAALLIGGVSFYYLAEKDYEKYQNATDDASKYASSMKTKRTVSTAMFVGAGLAIGYTAFHQHKINLYKKEIKSLKAHEPVNRINTSLAIIPHPDGAMFSFALSF